MNLLKLGADISLCLVQLQEPSTHSDPVIPTTVSKAHEARVELLRQVLGFKSTRSVIDVGQALTGQRIGQ